MFIKYSTGLIPPKKIRGKGSQGKKSADTPKLASVEVSNESDSKPARKQTGSRRVIKKKVLISVEDNIIPEPDAALELGKSMSLTEAVEEEAVRQVYATHEWIGIQTVTAEEQLVADIMQALKASRKSNRSQPHARGSRKGTGTKLEVPNESIGIISTLHEGTGTKPGVPDEVYSNEEEEKKDDDDDDDKSIDIKETGDEETDDKLIRGDEYVQENVDKEMKDDEVDVTRNSDQQMTDTTKADAEKSKEVKDDNKKAKLPPSSSSLSVSSGFGNQYLNLSSDKSIVENLKDTTDAEINSLLDVQIQQEILHIQSPSISLYLFWCSLSPQFSHQYRKFPQVSILEKDVQELKEVNHTTIYLALLRSEITSTINAYLGSSLGDTLQKSQSDPEKILRKRDHDGDDKDEDPSVGPKQGKKTKRRRTKESESSKKTSTTKETSKGNASTKGSKSDKYVHAEESVVKLTKDVIMDASNDDVVNDYDQPQNDLAPKHNWFTQPLTPPTSDPEWKKGKVVDDSQEHT
ncbi:hypothetical protein Tco_0480916 [Tanacetum coccineum]